MISLCHPPAGNLITIPATASYTYDGDGKCVQKSNGTIYWYGMCSDPLDQTDLTGSTTNAAFKEYVFFNGGWHTLSAWLSIGWPTLCDFVFCKGWDILCFVSRPRKPFTPPPQPFNPQSSPFPEKHLTC